MKNLFTLSLYYFFSFLILPTISKKQNQTTNKTAKYDDIASIYNWASKNKIYIHKNLQLYKNKLNDINHTFYYFMPNKTIKNNTLLLKIPYNVIISQESLENMHKHSKNKKLSNLWNKVVSIDKYLNYSSAKQLFYIATLLSHYTFKQKGKFYKKYEEYLNMYNYINLDDYPIFFKANEIAFLNSSSFGKEINNNFKSINNEYYLIKHALDMDENIIVEEYIKYRILSLANSLYYNNKTYVIPFIDCFKRKVNFTLKEYNAYIYLKPTGKNNYSFDIEIYSNKTLKKNQEISIIWKQVSNTENYLYYGFIDENNMIIPNILVEIINNNFKADLDIDSVNKKYKINFEDVIEPKTYDLNNDFYDEYLYGIYRNLSSYFDKYYHYNEGPYVMMKDNLQYYLNIYNELYTDEMINRNIEGINKKKYVKCILGMEKKLIENRIGILNDKIERVVQNKEERDIYELLKRASEANKKKNIPKNFKN